MIVSRENNFGAGQILFQAYQASNYVVLNAKFTVDPTTEAYQAAEVLEIKVPALSIDRSTVTPVFLAFHDRRESYGSLGSHDSSTILRSWIKDANTICIEKFDAFDQNGTLYFYIATLYPQLNQGIKTTKSTNEGVVATEDTPNFSFGSSPVLVVNEHWVFLKAEINCTEPGKTDSLWALGIKKLPNDISCFVPAFGNKSQYHYDCMGFSEIIIKEGRVHSSVRMRQGPSTIIYAFLVRGDNEGYPIEAIPQAQGDELVRAAVDETSSYDPELFLAGTMELGLDPFLYSAVGEGGSTGTNASLGYVFLHNAHIIPDGTGIFYCRSKKEGSLAIGFTSISMRSQYDSNNGYCMCALTKHERYELFDTTFYISY